MLSQRSKNQTDKSSKCWSIEFAISVFEFSIQLRPIDGTHRHKHTLALHMHPLSTYTHLYAAQSFDIAIHIRLTEMSRNASAAASEAEIEYLYILNENIVLSGEISSLYCVCQSNFTHRAETNMLRNAKAHFRRTKKKWRSTRTNVERTQKYITTHKKQNEIHRTKLKRNRVRERKMVLQLAGSEQSQRLNDKFKMLQMPSRQVK